MEFVPLIALGVLLWKLVDFFKFLRAKDWNAVVTQAIVWVCGIAVVILFAHSAFGDAIPVFNGLTLSGLGATEQAIVGLTVSSAGSVGYDFKKARDDSDSAKTPPLTNL